MCFNIQRYELFAWLCNLFSSDCKSVVQILYFCTKGNGTHHYFQEKMSRRGHKAALPASGHGTWSGRDAPKEIDLYHKSEIMANVEKELSRLNPDGTIKDGVPAKYKQMVEPKAREIQAEVAVIKKVYAAIKEANLIVDSKQFHKMVEDEKHPDKVERSEDETLLGQFREFYAQYEDESPLVSRDYQVIDGKLERYLRITKRETIDSTSKVIKKLRRVVEKEHFWRSVV